MTQAPMPQSELEEATRPGRSPTDADLEARIRLALGRWPELDPEVEGIVSRVCTASQWLDRSARETASRLGLTKEEFKVLLALDDGHRSHGALCRELGVSTGAMTNRLDKLERSGLVARSPDPRDRRGVQLELTDAGGSVLDKTINVGARRERELLSLLSASDRRQLNRLLKKLVVSLERELGS
jgi:DNA-binding MarR family transcriptional regulator